MTALRTGYPHRVAMFLADFNTVGGTTRLSFSHTERWTPAGRSRLAHVLLGDRVSGPLLALQAVAPTGDTDESPTLTPPHGHFCDSFRTPLRGSIVVGSSTYRPGQFRFNDGGKPYGRDGTIAGPDGAWAIIMMADRRGTRARPVRDQDRPALDAISDAARARYQHLVPEELEQGFAGISTSLAPAGQNSFVEGSFEDFTHWNELGEGISVAVGAMGDPATGPIVALVHGQPEALVSPQLRAGTDMLRCILAGSGSSPRRSFGAGDIEVFEPEANVPRLRAGNEGTDTVLVFGARTGWLSTDRPTGRDSEWIDGLAELIDAVSAAAARC